MADLDNKTRIPAAWAVTIVVTLLGLLATLLGFSARAGADQQRLTTLESRDEKQDARIDHLQSSQAASEKNVGERLIRLEESAKATQAVVERIERKLDRRQQ